MYDRKILIVDDEESLRLTFRLFLEREGFKNIFTASGLDEALAQIDSINFDLIISDIVLGGEKGTDLLRHIRESGLSCPVVMITGFPNLDSASEAVRLGAFEYIPKPVNKDTLLRLVRQALKFWELELEKQSLLRRNERYRLYLEAIFSSVNDAIIAIDSDLNIIKLNEAAARWLRDFKVEVQDHITRIPGEMGAACLNDAKVVIDEGQIVREHIVECVAPSGVSKILSINAAPLDIDEEVCNGAVIVARDITISRSDFSPHAENAGFHSFIGTGEAMQRVYRLIENVGKVDTAVLITGESGTGKELAAEALHAESPRNNMPLVKVDCAALPEDLLESELFGHLRGAFTGAERDRPGRLLQADKGTLFLDEIGDISSRVQLRLLRFLQEMTFTPVGRDTPVSVDVRVIAATNVDLKDKVRLGLFREDLYYRLKVVEIHMPPLRERPECLVPLINHFLMFFCRKHNRRILNVSDRALDALVRYPWPGNVREMKHVMERGCVLCHGRSLMLEHLPEELASVAVSSFVEAHEPGSETVPVSHASLNRNELEQSDRQKIIFALKQAAGNKTRAAEILSIDRSTLYRRLKRLNISISDR